ncbi:uncharacterized protein LOC6574467 [Drosophila mojavensis]|uniref:Uncharacterized protein n=1 Tax=Drosophila mojavensis TaxID=7230 RepID=B4KDG5_DROMO|nr:uncharacterized protein LOC6574467 [Drosophila mojavensis]EDW15974.1 uncharacterized protein Dmoj_GI22482 [Drosophila mojavensis]
MNPICKENINSAECQQWISEVYAHCDRLLADSQLEFWDEWWLNGQPVVSYQVPHLMSASECHTLKKQIEREIAAAAAASLKPELRFDLENMDSSWRLVIVVFVLCAALGIIGAMVWLLNNTLSRIARPDCGDCEYQGAGFRASRQSPRSFISFGNPCHPKTRYGPYRHNRLVVPRGACRAIRR